jgi:glucuronate isomerase
VGHPAFVVSWEFDWFQGPGQPPCAEIGSRVKIDAVSILHQDRLFPSEPTIRSIARRLYEAVRDLPLISPHGHTDARWFAENQPFPDPTSLFIVPDHYVFRMLYSQGIALQDLGIGKKELNADEARQIWMRFAENYYLFRGTPTRMWLDFAFEKLFGLEERLNASNANAYYDTISAKLATPAFRPRALYEQFNMEVLTTTNPPLDPLTAHQAIRDSGWKARILPTFRPDSVVDPEFDGFRQNVQRLGEMHGEDCTSWKGYLLALRRARDRFKKLGCTATDHGHPTAQTADLSQSAAAAVFDRVIAGKADAAEQELFRGQMLTEMARMSIEDGFVMQLHPGSRRNHNREIFKNFGRDVGADIPMPTDYVHALQPLLDRFGNNTALTLILFTLDESAYGRELAPLAGHYPCLRLGPPWWFFDSPEGMMRFRELTTETAGFYNTVGFNDDTRAFLSIPARHDVARRVDCAFLARLVAEHQLDEDEAAEVAHALAYDLARKAYRL